MTHASSELRSELLAIVDRVLCANGEMKLDVAALLRLCLVEVDRMSREAREEARGAAAAAKAEAKRARIRQQEEARQQKQREQEQTEKSRLEKIEAEHAEQLEAKRAREAAAEHKQREKKEQALAARAEKERRETAEREAKRAREAAAEQEQLEKERQAMVAREDQDRREALRRQDEDRRKDEAAAAKAEAAAAKAAAKAAKQRHCEEARHQRKQDIEQQETRHEQERARKARLREAQCKAEREQRERDQIEGEQRGRRQRSCSAASELQQQRIEADSYVHALRGEDKESCEMPGCPIASKSAGGSAERPLQSSASLLSQQRLQRSQQRIATIDWKAFELTDSDDQRALVEDRRQMQIIRGSPMHSDAARAISSDAQEAGAHSGASSVQAGSEGERWRASMLAVIETCQRAYAKEDDQLRASLQELWWRFDQHELDKGGLRTELRDLIGKEALQEVLDMLRGGQLPISTSSPSTLPK